jgi:hypothetical protein
MNTRLHVIAAILALATAGVVHAQSAQRDPATRAAVVVDFKQARAAGQLHRSDWDDELAARAPAGSAQSRAEVQSQYRAAVAARHRLPGPLASRNYNPYGAEILRPDVATRAEVRNDVMTARSAGALQPAGEAAVPMGGMARRPSLSAAF